VAKYIPVRLDGRYNLLVLAIGAGANTLEEIPDTRGQAECARVLNIELLLQQEKGARMSREGRRIAVGATDIAEPLNGHGILHQYRVCAEEMKRPGAAVATDQLPAATAR
jgi:hypothetical protein